MALSSPLENAVSQRGYTHTGLRNEVLFAAFLATLQRCYAHTHTHNRVGRTGDQRHARRKAERGENKNNRIEEREEDRKTGKTDAIGKKQNKKKKRKKEKGQKDRNIERTKKTAIFSFLRRSNFGFPRGKEQIELTYMDKDVQRPKHKCNKENKYNLSVFFGERSHFRGKTGAQGAFPQRARGPEGVKGGCYVLSRKIFPPDRWHRTQGARRARGARSYRRKRKTGHNASERKGGGGRI